MALVIGVDSSTQSVKVEVRDAFTGALRSSGRVGHPPTTPPISETDPDSWWSAFLLAVAEALSTLSADERRDVVAISVGGQQHGMVALDAQGVAVHPGKLWNDTESASHADELVERFGAKEWAQACGSVPVAAFTITKLAWLKSTHPTRYERMSIVLLPHDEITRRLTGSVVTDRGDASGTGYFSAAEGRYRQDLLALVDVNRDWSASLPTVLGPTDVAGTLLPAIADEFGLSSNVLVGPGSGDNMAAALGVGLTTGDVAISFGTSGTVYAVSSTPTHDASGSVAGFADATGNFLPLVCTLNATKVTDAIGRLLGVNHEEFDALALAGVPGADGAVLLPYFDGERTPNRPNATGVLSGLRSDVSRENIARASVEGVICGLLDGFDALRASGVEPHGRVYLLGGGAKSVAYRRVAADLFQRQVTIASDDEHVARGAALQAAVTWMTATDRVRVSAAADAFHEIQEAWRSSTMQVIDPSISAEQAKAVREAYSVARA